MHRTNALVSWNLFVVLPIRSKWYWYFSKTYPLLANCRRQAKLQRIGRLTTWLSEQQNQFSGALGSSFLLIGQILNLDSAILVHIPLIWYATSTLMHQLCSINMDTECLLAVFFDSFVLPLLPVTRFRI